MRITRATPDDLDTLVAFRDQAAAWLAGKGIDQWQEPWPTEDLMVEGMLRNIEAGRPSSSGTTTTPRRPPSPSTASPSRSSGLSRNGRNPPLYAHKVTVDRAYGGQGLGTDLLDWAGTNAADEGADWLRVDVWTTNERLQHYYLRQGFTYVRTVVLPHNSSGALFQRPAQRVPTPHPRGREPNRLSLGPVASSPQRGASFS